MLLYLFLLIKLHIISNPVTETLKGAWELRGVGDPGEVAALIATDNYLTVSVYNEISNAFLRTYGGRYRIGEGKCFMTQEFNTRDTSDIGKEITFKLLVNETSLTLEDLVKTTWTKIDDAPASAPLAGCWKIAARAGSDGNMAPMSSGSRKTLKINSGTRFQWVAINPVTKQFFGTGGGSYTLMDGKYTEHLAFFSRDPNRVGSQLSFDADVQGGKWVHSGKGSTGNPVNEVWERQ